MRGAAASVNLTVVVAMATLLAVGGILTGPAILDCSRNPDGFGACLRDRLDQTQPPAPPPVTDDGWIDAAANEYEPPASPPVELEASPAALTAAVPLATSSEPVEVAIAPPAELAIASPEPEPGTASVALIGPQGTVSVAEASTEPPLAISPEPLAPTPDLATPVAPPSSEPAPVELSAEPSSEPEPSAPSSEQPTLVVEFNPAYPNVVVLPAPLTGDNSSFRSLQLN